MHEYNCKVRKGISHSIFSKTCTTFNNFQIYLIIYIYPLRTAASAFNIDEPAAPMTANKGQYEIQRQYRVGSKLTVMAQRNKLQIKDAALILSHTSHADGVSLAQVAIQTRLGSVLLVKDLDGRIGG